VQNSGGDPLCGTSLAPETDATCHVCQNENGFGKLRPNFGLVFHARRTAWPRSFIRSPALVGGPSPSSAADPTPLESLFMNRNRAESTIPELR
jgi:hypothetical protein